MGTNWVAAAKQRLSATPAGRKVIPRDIVPERESERTKTGIVVLQRDPKRH